MKKLKIIKVPNEGYYANTAIKVGDVFDRWELIVSLKFIRCYKVFYPEAHIYYGVNFIIPIDCCEEVEVIQGKLWANADNYQLELPLDENINYIKPTRLFETGAKRDSDLDKPYVHNLQGYTRLRFGYLTRTGADKYGDSNFLKGFPKESSLASLDRHLAKYMNGDKSEDHLAAIIFNVQLIMLEEEKEGIKPDYYFKTNK